MGWLHARQQPVPDHPQPRAPQITLGQKNAVVRRIMFFSEPYQPLQFPRRDFARITQAFSCAADMVDGDLGDVTDLKTKFAQAQAKIRLLAVKKKFQVEAAEFFVKFAPDDHACADDPRDVS